MRDTVEHRDIRLERRANFISKAVAIYGDSYDYSSIDFIDSKTPIGLRCGLHGEFTVRPANHLNGQHCRKCKQSANALLNAKRVALRFAEKARRVHGDRFDYSRAYETDDAGRALIICPIHGEFWQLKSNHLSGRGCRLCSNEARTTTVSEFIARSREAHGDTFDYSRVLQFASTRDQVEIICRVHGSFLQIARDHMRGVACQRCSIEKTKVTFEEFLERARAAHGDRYGYLEESWRIDPQFVTVICPEHGPYQQNWQNHCIGMGCSKCKSFVSKPEIEIFEALSLEVPETIQQSVRSVISPKELDIWIPELKLAIEFNGTAYHDKAIWAESLRSSEIRSRELNKTELCSELNIRLIHIWEDDYRRDSEWWLNAILEAIARARIEDIAGLDSHIHSLELRASEQIPETTGQLSSWSYSV